MNRGISTFLSNQDSIYNKFKKYIKHFYLNEKK